MSRAINTSFVERQNGTDRRRNARKARKTYRFSKDWQVHEAMTYFTMYSYNFCWSVRTLRVKDEQGYWRQGVWSRVVFGDFQAAGFSLMPSMKTVPLTTSASSGEPFNDRQPFDALSISLNTIVRHATRLPLPLVLS